jgi:nucleotide-binding universal stress UspA family protein
MIKKILVPIDGSDHARKAIEFASDIASKYNATLYFIHVVSETEFLEDVLDYGKLKRTEKPPLRVYLQKIGEELIREAETEAGEKGVEDIQSTVARGNPAQRIIEFAREKGVDMIVLGSRGAGSVKTLLLGSVSHKVCHLADCTCVTVN